MQRHLTLVIYYYHHHHHHHASRTINLDRIKRRQLNWYGHLLRIEDSRWPRKIYQWALTVEGEEEETNNHGRTKYRASGEAETRKNAFGNGWTALGYVDDDNNNNNRSGTGSIQPGENNWVAT